MFLLLISLNVNFQVYRDSSLIPTVRVVYSFPTSELSYFKRDSLYVGKYRTALVIYKDKHQVGGKSKIRPIKFRSYDSTILSSPIRDSITYSFKSTGKFKVQLEIWDMNSQKYWVSEKNVEFKELKHAHIGEIIWKSNPNFHIGMEDTLRFSFNVLNPLMESAFVNVRIKNTRGDKFFSDDKIIVKKYTNVSYAISAKIFSEDEYFIYVEMKNKKRKEKESLKFVVEKPFFQSKRFIKKVKEMEYIAGRSILEKMISSTPEKRKKLWDKFWKSKDPTPATEKNEYRDEYFRRVDYANEHFHSPFSPGWRTDMGKAYILFGPPDSIENHPFELESKAYIVWYYYDRGWKLIFVDEYNLGDYILINPPQGFR